MEKTTDHTHHNKFNWTDEGITQHIAEMHTPPKYPINEANMIGTITEHQQCHGDDPIDFEGMRKPDWA